MIYVYIERFLLFVYGEYHIENIYVIDIWRIWPGELHGLYSPWGRIESDMME